MTAKDGSESRGGGRIIDDPFVFSPQRIVDLIEASAVSLEQLGICVFQSAHFSIFFSQIHDFQTGEVFFEKLPMRNRRIQIKIRSSEISGGSQLAGTDTAAPDRYAALVGKQPDRRRDLWRASTDGRTVTMAAGRPEERENCV